MMSINFNNAISFTAKQDDRRDAEKKVVTGGGAIAATATATRAKAARSGFDMFRSSKEVSQGMRTATNAAKTVTNTIKKSTTLWGKVCENAKWAKEAIIKWGTKFKNTKFIKPLIESKVFRGCAGFLGYGFGLVTLISGCSDIARVTTDTINGNLLKKDA